MTGALVAALATSCSGMKLPSLGQSSGVGSYYGAVAADEPNAALAARNVLLAGGSAGDAAVALYFTLAVTLPSAAGLGGGGACVIYDKAATKAMALDFLPRAPARAVAPDGASVAVPGNVRGMAVLHARLGRLQWSEMVFAGERMARFGHPTSRALASEVARSAAALGSDREAARLLLPGGRPLAEGDALEQLSLAGVLGQIRAQGAGTFYSGTVARAFVDGAEGLAAAPTMEDMHAYRPSWSDPVTGTTGSHEVYFPPTLASGQIAQRMWKALGEDGAWRRAEPSARQDLVAAAYRTVLAETGGDAARNPSPTSRGGTSFAVSDGLGNAVACAVTQGAPFGLGRLIPGTGIFAGRAPSSAADPAFTRGLATAIIVNRPTREPYLALGAAGGDAAETLVTVLLRATVDRTPLASALALLQTAATANAIYCPSGMVSEPSRCAAATDPRGAGLAVLPAGQ